jgi:hypothetical protein
LRVQGKAVRDRFFDPKSLLRIVLAVMLLSASQAMAEDDDDDTPFEEKLIKSLLGADKASIDYRERSPLVVPPTATLPPPETSKAIADPAWPKDADVQRAKKTKKRDPREDQKDWGRALTPDQLAGRGPTGSGGLGAPTSRQNEDAVTGRPLLPNELGARGNIFGSLFSKDSNETAVFPGEPARENLTDPPPGYLTPSPNYPYGLMPSKEAPKPATLDDRAVGRKD